MREIKFRVWDKNMGNDGIMIYSDNSHKKDDVIICSDYSFNADNGKMECVAYDCYDDSFGYSQETVEHLDNIMQYTGLKDKNGVEIYEGDILKLGRKDLSYFGLVIYNIVSFEIKGLLTGLEDYFWNYNIEEIEVVGNIYENSELLEGKDEL